MLLHDPRSAWYADFFTEIPNEFWRRAVAPAATEAEVAFIERLLNRTGPARILDVPCCSGRHALALAAHGHQVVGIDISTDAVEYARRAAAARGLAVELHLGDMRRLPADGSWDALCAWATASGTCQRVRWPISSRRRPRRSAPMAG